MAFEHLSLPQRINSAKYNSPYGKGKIPVVIDPSQETIENQNNREVHGENLQFKSQKLITEWVTDFENRSTSIQTPLPKAITIFLHVNPKHIDPHHFKPI